MYLTNFVTSLLPLKPSTAPVYSPIMLPGLSAAKKVTTHTQALQDPANAETKSQVQQFLTDYLWSAESQRQEAQLNREWSAEQARQAMSFEAGQAALNRQFQLASAREAMDFERIEADKLRQWQEVQNQRAMDYNTLMSNTSYQRAIKDLKAAGLNPILAYARGASTPTGVTSSGASGSGFAASGSTARGYMGSSQQANVRGQLTEITGALSEILSSAGKLVGAIKFQGFYK